MTIKPSRSKELTAEFVVAAELDEAVSEASQSIQDTLIAVIDEINQTQDTLARRARRDKTLTGEEEEHVLSKIEYRRSSLISKAISNATAFAGALNTAMRAEQAYDSARSGLKSRGLEDLRLK